MLQLKNGTKQRRASLAARSYECWQLLQNDNHCMTRISLKLYKPADPTVSREKAIEKTQSRQERRYKADFYETSIHKRDERPYTRRNFFFLKKLDFKAKFILINKTFNLKRLFTFKEKQYQNKLHRPSVFCRITCSCKSTYIAQTSRNLITRLKNHDPTSPNRQNTDVSKHLTDNPNHKIAVDRTEVTAQTNHGRKLLITETLLIQKHDPNLNVDRTSIPLYFLTCECYE